MPVKYITVGPGTLTIGADADLTDFSAQATACKLVPSVDNGDPINVLSGEQVPGDRSESFALEGTFLQDLQATGLGTTDWLFEHRGETHDFVFVPATAAGRQVSGELVVEAIDIGGDAKTKPTSDFSFIVINPALGDVTVALAAAGIAGGKGDAEL